MINDSDDRELLENKMNEMIQSQSKDVVGYLAGGSEIDSSTLKSRVEEAEARLKKGKGIDHEDVKREADNW